LLHLLLDELLHGQVLGAVAILLLRSGFFHHLRVFSKPKIAATPHQISSTQRRNPSSGTQALRSSLHLAEDVADFACGELLLARVARDEQRSAALESADGGAALLRHGTF
jgi:hypothetical protein